MVDAQSVSSFRSFRCAGVASGGGCAGATLRLAAASELLMPMSFASPSGRALAPKGVAGCAGGGPRVRLRFGTCTWCGYGTEKLSSCSSAGQRTQSCTGGRRRNAPQVNQCAARTSVCASRMQTVRPSGLHHVTDAHLGGRQRRSSGQAVRQGTLARKAHQGLRSGVVAGWGPARWRRRSKQRRRRGATAVARLPHGVGVLPRPLLVPILPRTSTCCVRRYGR